MWMHASIWYWHNIVGGIYLAEFADESFLNSTDFLQLHLHAYSYACKVYEYEVSWNFLISWYLISGFQEENFLQTVLQKSVGL